MNDEPQDDMGGLPGDPPAGLEGADRAFALSDVHGPTRPSWLCGACYRPYPCQVARVRLLRAFKGDTLTLLMMMSGMLTDAYADLPTVTDGPEAVSPFRLWTRFMDWIGAERRGTRDGGR